MKSREKRDRGGYSVTEKRDTLARARTSYGSDVTFVTRDISRLENRDVTVWLRDSDTALEAPCHHHGEQSVIAIEGLP